MTVSTSKDYDYGFRAGQEAYARRAAKVFPGDSNVSLDVYNGWHDGWANAWRAAQPQKPTKTLAAGFTDVTNASVEVKITGKNLWVNVDGVCRLRAYNSEIKVER